MPGQSGPGGLSILIAELGSHGKVCRYCPGFSVVFRVEPEPSFWKLSQIVPASQFFPAKYRTDKVIRPVSDVNGLCLLTDAERAIGDTSFFRCCWDSCRGRSTQPRCNCRYPLYRMLTLRLKLNGSLKDKPTRMWNQCCDILESRRRQCDFALTMLLDA